MRCTYDPLESMPNPLNSNALATSTGFSPPLIGYRQITMPNTFIPFLSDLVVKFPHRCI